MFFMVVGFKLNWSGYDQQNTNRTIGIEVLIGLISVGRQIVKGRSNQILIRRLFSKDRIWSRHSLSVATTNQTLLSAPR